MANEYKRKVLEDRLQLLDALEALNFQARQREYYDERLADFGLSTTPESMKAHLDELSDRGVANFILPTGISQLAFWDAPVRIKEINLEKLQAMRDSLRTELTTLTGVDATDSPTDVQDNDEVDKDVPGTAARPEPPASASGLAVFTGVLGVIGTVAGIVVAIWSWHVLRTDLARALVVAGIVIFAAAATRIYIRVRARRLGRQAVMDLIFVAALCVCATLGFAKIPGGTSSPSHLPKIKTSLRSLIANAPPTVGCPQLISGSFTGNVPSGDVLIIGYRPQNIPTYTFWPSVNQRGNHWSSTIYIGSPRATGELFTLVYVLVPSHLRDYLISTFNEAVVAPHFDYYWDNRSIPPFALSPHYQNVTQPNPHC